MQKSFRKNFLFLQAQSRRATILKAEASLNGNTNEWKSERKQSMRKQKVWANQIRAFLNNKNSE